MIYIFSWLSRRHPNVMRGLLAVRSALYIGVGNFLAVAVGVGVWWLTNFFAAVIVSAVVVLLVAVVPQLRWLRLLQVYMGFRRRWPSVYAQSGMRRLVDDGELVRSVMAAPKLGEIPQFKDGSIVLTVRPSVGSTLKHIEENVDVLAAAYPSIRSIEVRAGFAQASKGLLTLTPMEAF